jgi:hypothetical protein
MKAFRFFLVAVFVTVLVYTFIVGSKHGWSIFSLFFGDIMAMNWAGQFNLDFSFFLIFVGVWVAWRNMFNATGIALGLFTLVGGIPFVSAYLFILSLKANVGIKEILIGKN